MKILYRILVILLWIPIILLFIFGLPIALIISPVIYIFIGRTEGLFFDMYLMLFDKMINILDYYLKKGE